MKSRQLVIRIKEIGNKKIIGFELDGISKDEAIVVLNRCLFRLLDDYDDFIKIESKV
jgi:hypothetical protein